MRVHPAPGDEGPVPAQQGCRFDVEVSEKLAGKESGQAGQNRLVGGLQHRSVAHWWAGDTRNCRVRPFDLSDPCSPYSRAPREGRTASQIAG